VWPCDIELMSDVEEPLITFFLDSF